MKPIDAHVHLGNLRIGGIVERMDIFRNARVSHSMLHRFIMKAASGHRLDVKKFLGEYGLGGCALVPLSKQDENYIRGIKIKNVFRLRFFDRHTEKCEPNGFDGYKIHTVIENLDILSDSYSEFFSAAARKKVPLEVHVGFYPLKNHTKSGAMHKLKSLLDSYDLRLMVCHAGGEHWKELISMSENYDFYIELSLSSKKAVSALHDNVSADRLIFGSDYPIGDPLFRKDMISEIAGKKDSDKMLRKNAIRFFRR